MTRILTIIALLFATPAWANEDERLAVLELADDFARCSAIFKVMSLVSASSEKSFSSTQDQQLANGAQVASFYLAQKMGRRYARERTESLIETEFTMWMALLENNPEAMANQYEPKYKFCIENLNLQEEIINSARKEAYGD